MVVALLGVAQGSKDIGEDAACKAPACCDAKAIFPHKKELVFTDHSRAEIPEGCTTIDVGLGKIGQDTESTKSELAEAFASNPQLEILKVQGIRKMKGTVQDA
eukprot:gene7282-15022_t